MTVNCRTFHAPVLSFALAAIAGPASLGCQTATPTGVAARAERTLATSYPGLAARIVDAPTAFERRGEVFARAAIDRSPRDDHRSLDIALPRRGDGAIAVSAGGLAIRVREIDAHGDGALAGAAVAYPRAGGTSLWAATPDGAEEWLLLDAGVARAGNVAAAWEIDGARLRDAGGVIEILDGDGVPRIRVTAPEAWAESGLPAPARLSAHGNHIELVVDGGGAPVLADPSWSSTGKMLAQRGYHASALLPNGKVFVAGGATSGATLGSAEIYDPVTNAWSTAAPMADPRMGPIATLLGNGKVLLAGTMGAPVNTAELYDPNSNAWSPAGTMSASRSNGTSTELDDGRVLFVGGSGMNPLATAEIYNPGTNSWTAAASVVTGRSAHTATLLQNGKVLVASGFNGGGVINSVEIYDPAANTWSPGPAMATGGGYSTATLLQNGKVLVVGGTAGPGGGIARAEIYDPASNSWSLTGSLVAPRFYHTATLLPTGKVVVAGGLNAFGSLSSSEIYDPGAGTWSPGTALGMGRNAHSATLLPSGVILAAGGLNVLTGYLDTAEGYGPNGTGATGIPCGSASECSSGYCVDGVCCGSACGAGPCDACSVAAGADTNGTCKLFTGPTCDDGNPCTQTDTCSFGSCSGGNPVACPAPDECHNVGVCSSATGVCTTPQQPDETPCLLGACLSGVCAPTISSSSGPSSSAASSSAASSSAASSSAASSSAASSSASAGSSSSASSGGGSSAATSTSAGAGGAGGAAASGAGGAVGAGGAIGAGGTPSTGTGVTTGGRTGSTSGAGDSGGCSVQGAGAPAGAAGPFALLLALAALLRARARSIGGRRFTTRD
jgi:hypothetical protein